MLRQFLPGKHLQPRNFSTKKPKPYTLQKINMEPNNHLIEKKKHLPNLHYCVPTVHFPGCKAKYFHFFINFKFVSPRDKTIRRPPKIWGILIEIIQLCDFFHLVQRIAPHRFERRVSSKWIIFVKNRRSVKCMKNKPSHIQLSEYIRRLLNEC